MSVKKKNSDDIFAEDDDFDAEAFFGIKEENLESNDMGIDDDLMMKAIEIMTQNQQPMAASLKPPMPKKEKILPELKTMSEKMMPKSYL